MFHLLHCKILFRFISNNHNVRIKFLHNPFRNCHNQTNPPSFLFQYLQSSLGFSPERALTLSQQFKGRNPKNPDSVLAFFKSHGFSETHIKSIMDRLPCFLFSPSPESSLRPKFQFFKDKGISGSVLVDLMVSNPGFFTCSLERHIKPVFNLLSNALGTDELAAQLLIRSKLKFNPHLLFTNLTILRNCDAQNRHISKLFKKQPLALEAKSDRFIGVVEMVKGIGFRPQTRMFVDAIFTILGLSRQTWDAKFKVYASFGLSTEEILLLFRRHPGTMKLSEEKIRKGFDYLTKEVGWAPTYISSYPTLLFYRLEGRTILRHRFLQLLVSKGFIKNDKVFANSLTMSVEKFFKNFVKRYESEVPDILNIYEHLMGSKRLNIRDMEKDCNVR
ncbi:hypothetical protein ACLOJK_025006 [Asimina triloba]